jgi:glucokinase
MTADRFTIGVDLGGTNLRIAAYAEEAGLLETILLSTRLRDGRDAVAADICQGIRRLLDRYARTGSCAGIGIGSPGPLELPAGRLREPPNLPGWDGFELRATIEGALGMPVEIENDANAAALAECVLGKGKTLGIDSLCMLTLGTGVGGGIILNGKIWDGMVGMAGEAGHVNIWTDGAPCGCGGRGCLEAYASATAIRRITLEMIARENAPLLAALAESNPRFTSRDVAELAQEGDPQAKRIFEDVGRALGIGLASLVNMLNLPLYVLGGGVAKAWTLLCRSLFAELRRRSYVYRLTDPGEDREVEFKPRRTYVALTELGSDAGLLGACLLPFTKVSGATGGDRAN